MIGLAHLPRLSTMGALMLEAEAAEGRTPIWPRNKPAWLDAEDWEPWPVLAIEGDELHIVAISSTRRGSLKRLIEGAATAGLSPVIVCPIGPIMPAILERWNWKRTLRGRGAEVREEWRPQ